MNGMELLSFLQLNHSHLHMSKDIMPSLRLSLGLQGMHIVLGNGEGVRTWLIRMIEMSMGIDLNGSTGDNGCMDSPNGCLNMLNM